MTHSLSGALGPFDNSCRKLKEFSICNVDCITDRSVLALVSCGVGLPSIQQHTDTNDDSLLGLTPYQAAGMSSFPLLSVPCFMCWCLSATCQWWLVAARCP